MEWFEAVLLGLIQGLTEFLPISSSGHLEIGKVLLGVETQDDLLFTTMVHAATVLSTVVVFRRQIWDLLKGFFCGLKEWKIAKDESGKRYLVCNDQTDYLLKIGRPVLQGFCGVTLRLDSRSGRCLDCYGRASFLLGLCFKARQKVNISGQ